MIYSDETVREFKNNVYKKRVVEEQRLQGRYVRARGSAYEIAKKLCDEYGAQKVILVGSLLHPDRFTERSDLDLVVYGLSPELLFNAIADFMNEKFDVDIIPAEKANAFMKETIEKEGEALYERQNS